MKLSSVRLASRTLFLVVSAAGIFGLGMSGLAYAWFFCYACPYAVASCPIGLVEHSFADMRLQSFIEGLQLLLYVVGLVTVTALIAGRMACGWACPIGFLQDGIDRLRNWVMPKKWLIATRIPGSHLRFVKYAFIVLIPVTSFIFADTVYTNYCPVGGITGTIPTLIIDFSSWEMGTSFLVKVASVTFFTLLAAAIARGWCRFLCPLGAYLALFNGVSVFRWRNDRSACKDCGVCASKCQMGLDPKTQIQTAECVMCGRCADACPAGSLKLGWLMSKDEGAEKDEPSDDAIAGASSSSCAGCNEAALAAEER